MARIYSEQQFPLNEDRLSQQETLFHNANGYLGVRGTLEEGTQFKSMRGMYVNGFFDIIPMKQAEKLYGLTEDKEAMLNVADTQTILVEAEGEIFSLFTGTVEEIERVLDMDAGITERRVTWLSPGGKRLRLIFRRMASFDVPNLFTQECEITPLNFTGVIRVTSLQKALVRNYADADDPRLASDNACRLQPAGHEMLGDVSLLSVRTQETGFTLCTAVAHDLNPSADAQWTYHPDDHSAEWTACLQAAEGQTLRLIKYTVITESRRYASPEAEAKACMQKVRGALPALYQRQREFLNDFWHRADMRIDGNEQDHIAMLFNMYQLLQSAGRDGQCSIAAKGLSGEGYEGHYFWDTEMYMFPYFLLTSPQIARQLLLYRYSILPAARDNARLLGHAQGALYPWRTIGGKECSGYFPSGTAQYHINGAIAYAVTEYWMCTGDMEFMLRYGAEILLETARLWMDLGNWVEGSFRIHDVTGPDEYTCMVNNNFYTNACAQYNMRWAVKAVRMIETQAEYPVWRERMNVSQQELDAMSQAADAMYLPYDEKLGINPQDDSFLDKPVWDLDATPRENFPLLLHYHPLHLYRYQVCKQPDTVLAYFIFDGVADRETAGRSFDYYEKITTHDSSLSTCIFSIVASQLGKREKAEQYFGDSLTADLVNAHHNTRDGIHTANMGGNYMAVVNGFAGLRLHEDELSISPWLPSKWTGYSFRFSWQNRLLSLEVNGTECVLTLLEGEAMTIKIYGCPCSIPQAGRSARIPLAGR